MHEPMVRVFAPNTPAVVVARLEAELRTVLTDMQARVLSLQIFVSRLGEDDAWRRWNSRVWRAKIVLGPVFPKTWPRQRILLAVSAACADEAKRLGQAVNSGGHLFHLDPSFDAALRHAISLLDVDRCAKLNAMVDAVQWHEITNLKSFEQIEPVEDPRFVSASSSVATLVNLLSHASREEPWHNGAAL